MGNRPDAKILKKWKRKWKMAPGLKWPKNGHRNGKMAKNPIVGSIFRPFRARGCFHFLSHFSRIFASGRFPILFLATSIATININFWAGRCLGHTGTVPRHFVLSVPGMAAVRPWDDCPARAVRKKNVYVFCVCVCVFFFRPHFPPWWGARKQPINLNGPFSTLNGPFRSKKTSPRIRSTTRPKRCNPKPQNKSKNQTRKKDSEALMKTKFTRTQQNENKTRKETAKLGNCAACYRIEKRGTPENSWGGCWEECRKKSGCWRECWRGCCS